MLLVFGHLNLVLPEDILPHEAAYFVRNTATDLFEKDRVPERWLSDLDCSFVAPCTQDSLRGHNGHGRGCPACMA